MALGVAILKQDIFPLRVAEVLQVYAWRNNLALASGSLVLPVPETTPMRGILFGCWAKVTGGAI